MEKTNIFLGWVDGYNLNIITSETSSSYNFSKTLVNFCGESKVFIVFEYALNSVKFIESQKICLNFQCH